MIDDPRVDYIFASADDSGESEVQHGEDIDREQ